MNVCSVEEKVELDVRVLDYSDPKDEGDLGAPCILEENYADGYQFCSTLVLQSAELTIAEVPK